MNLKKLNQNYRCTGVWVILLCEGGSGGKRRRADRHRIISADYIGAELKIRASGLIVHYSDMLWIKQFHWLNDDGDNDDDDKDSTDHNNDENNKKKTMMMVLVMMIMMKIMMMIIMI